MNGETIPERCEHGELWSDACYGCRRSPDQVCHCGAMDDNAHQSWCQMSGLSQPVPSSNERVSDTELAASLKRYGNNKAGDMYRLLLELQERRAHEPALQRENLALRNLAENLRPGPISEALGGVEHERPYRSAVETRAEHDPASATESDGCPTELAVLKRFWRERHALIPPDGPMPSGCAHQWKYFQTVETLRGGCGFLRCEFCGAERVTQRRDSSENGSGDAT